MTCGQRVNQVERNYKTLEPKNTTELTDPEKEFNTSEQRDEPVTRQWRRRGGAETGSEEITAPTPTDSSGSLNSAYNTLRETHRDTRETADTKSKVARSDLLHEGINEIIHPLLCYTWEARKQRGGRQNCQPRGLYPGNPPPRVRQNQDPPGLRLSDFITTKPALDGAPHYPQERQIHGQTQSSATVLSRKPTGFKRQEAWV